MNRFVAKLTSTAIPFSPDSCSERTAGTVVVLTSAAPGAALAYTRMRPGRSVTNIVPSGAKATSHGITRPCWTTVAVGTGAAAAAGSGGPAVRATTATSSETTRRVTTEGCSPWLSDMVPPRGFEPLISTLKGWRPRPLDDGGADSGPGQCYQRTPDDRASADEKQEDQDDEPSDRHGRHERHDSGTKG